jgi:UDP-N-acetylglucosamine 2-epimerase (non-hydrolysing)
MNNPIILVIGTRAEAIKLIPLYLALQKECIPTLLCATSQHAELLEQACKIFNVTPDFNLHIMKKNQDLFYVTQAVLEKTKTIYLQTHPKLVVVHGDTTTTMAAALSAFYLQIPIAHVEAGLRTGNMFSPFPEEMNRKVVGQIATYHFTPTAFSTANILAEGVRRENVFCTGNTIVDALYMIKEKIETNQVEIESKIKDLVQDCKKNNKKIVLLTAHRRESFNNGGLLRIFSSMREFAKTHPDVEIFFPVHPNPNVKRAVEESELAQVSNIHLLTPLNYKEIVYLMMNADWIASDSGGIQEEAVSLGKPVLVLRDVTERWEGVWEGAEILVGTNQELILQNMEKLYHTQLQHCASTIYGDGSACKRIVSVLKMGRPHEAKNINRGPGLHRPADSACRSK